MSSEASVKSKAPRRRWAFWLPLTVLVAGFIGVTAYMFQLDGTDPVSGPGTDVVEVEDLEPDVVWETEVFANAASEQLAKLAKAIEATAAVESSVVAALVAPTFSCGHFRGADGGSWSKRILRRTEYGPGRL